MAAVRRIADIDRSRRWINAEQDCLSIFLGRASKRGFVCSQDNGSMFTIVVPSELDLVGHLEI